MRRQALYEAVVIGGILIVCLLLAFCIWRPYLHSSDQEESVQAETSFEEKEASMTTYGYYGQAVEVNADLSEVTGIYENDEAADLIETDIPKETSLVQTSYEIDQQVEAELNSGNYDFENPLVILNPYRISPLTGLIVFQTEEEVSVRVTVKGKTEEADISGEIETASTLHRVPLIGLYANYDNSVILELLDESGEAIYEQELIVTTESLPQFFDDMIEPVEESGSSAFGLTLVSGMGCNYPFAYDCNGEIRWYFSRKSGNYGVYHLSNDRLIFQDSDGYVPCQQKPQTTNLYEMDYLGRAYQLYYIPNGSHHEVIEMSEGGNLLCLTSTLETHYEDEIIEIDRETGEIKNSLKLEDVFGTTYVNKVDWVHLNTVSYQEEDNTILISCRNLHSIIKLDWTTHEIIWILCNPEFWEGTDFEQYVLQPEEDFLWNYQQHTAYQLDVDLDGNPDTVEISLFDNHYDSARKVDYFDGLENSFLTIYSVNEEENTVNLLHQISIPRSRITSATIYDADSGHIFGMCGWFKDSEEEQFKKRYGMNYEFDLETGELLNQFSIKKTFYRSMEMKIDYNDLAGDMEIGDIYIKGSLRPAIEIDADIKSPSETLEDEVSFKIMGSVLYVGALDHTVSQLIFKGSNHIYVYDSSGIREHSEDYQDFVGDLPIPLGNLAADTYDIFCVYEDRYCRTEQSFTVK